MLAEDIKKAWRNGASAYAHRAIIEKALRENERVQLSPQALETLLSPAWRQEVELFAVPLVDGSEPKGFCSWFLETQRELLLERLHRLPESGWEEKQNKIIAKIRILDEIGDALYE